MLVVDNAHCEKCAVRVALNDRAADSRPPLAERLLRHGSGHMVVLRESALPGVQFNEFRSTGAFSLASHALNQRRRSVAADALAKILLKGYITILLAFDGAAELNDRVGDQPVIGPARFSFKAKDFREAFPELFVPLRILPLAGAVLGNAVGIVFVGVGRAPRTIHHPQKALFLDRMIRASRGSPQERRAVFGNERYLRRTGINADARFPWRGHEPHGRKAFENQLQEVAHPAANHPPHNAAVFHLSRLARVRWIRERVGRIGRPRNDDGYAALVPGERLLFRVPDDVRRGRFPFERMKSTAARLVARPAALAEHEALEGAPNSGAELLRDMHAEKAFILGPPGARLVFPNKPLCTVSMGIGDFMKAVLREPPELPDLIETAVSLLALLHSRRLAPLGRSAHAHACGVIETLVFIDGYK